MIRSYLALHSASRLAKSGRIDEAVKSLERASAQTPDPRLAIQKALLSTGKRDWEALRRLFPKNAAALLTASLLAYGAGDIEEAGMTAMGGLSARPQDPSLNTLALLSRLRAGQGVDLAALRRHAGHSILAVRALAFAEVERRIIQSRPDDTGAVEKDDALGGPFGFILDRLDDLAAIMGLALSQAINLFTHAADPKKRAVYRLIAQGDSLWAMRRHDEAAKRFEEALQMDTACPEALESLARYYIDKGEIGKATACFAVLERAGASATDAAPAHILRISADIAFFSGNYEKASNLYLKVIEASPHDYIPPYRRGLCLLRMGDARGAVKSLKMALGLPNPRLMEERFGALEAVCKA